MVSSIITQPPSIMVHPTPCTRFSTNRETKLTGGQHSPQANTYKVRRLALGQRCVTPRQACPRPNGFGRNLRSKTRWFTGFCNSHQVSHFATFFIDARAKISVAESRLILIIGCIHSHAPVTRAQDEHAQVHVPWRRPRRGSLLHRAAPLRKEHHPTLGGGGNSSSVRLR